MSGRRRRALERALDQRLEGTVEGGRTVSRRRLATLRRQLRQRAASSVIEAKPYFRKRVWDGLTSWHYPQRETGGE